MIWKRLPVLIAVPFLLSVATEGQNQHSPNGPGAGSAEAKEKTYTVAGAVKRPGSYIFDRRTTVFEAINEAGGFEPGGLTPDDFRASKKEIKIVRGGQVLHFNYDDFLGGKNRDGNVELEDGDIVQVAVVPKSKGPKLPPEP